MKLWPVHLNIRPQVVRISGRRLSEYPAAVCLNIRPQVRPNNRPPFVQIFGRRSSESLVAVRTNIQPPFVHIFGRRSSESPASVRPNIWPMFVRISSLLLSECPATIHPQMRLPFRPIIRPSFVWISGLCSSSSSNLFFNSLPYPQNMVFPRGIYNRVHVNNFH